MRRALLATSCIAAISGCAATQDVATVGLTAAGVPAPIAAAAVQVGALAFDQLFCAQNGKPPVAVSNVTVTSMEAAALAAACPPGSVPVPQPPASTTVQVVPPAAAT